MSKKFEYAGTITDQSRPYDITVKKTLWPFIFGDQFFTPRFKVKFKNEGKEIRKGSFSFDIVEFDKIGNLSEISLFKGPFQDVFNHSFENLRAGKTLNFKFSINGRFIKPEHYILRMTLTEWIPQDSPYKELMATLTGERAANNPDKKLIIREEQIKQITDNSLKTWKEMGIDPYQRPQGSFKGNQLLDFRFVEKIKIHSLPTVLSSMGALVGGIIGAGIGMAVGIVKIVEFFIDTQ